MEGGPDKGCQIDNQAPKRGTEDRTSSGDFQQQLQNFAKQGPKKVIWLAPHFVLGAMCSSESPHSGEELPVLNPHCESQHEKSQRAGQPTVGYAGARMLQEASQGRPVSIRSGPHLPPCHTHLSPLLVLCCPNTLRMVPQSSKLCSPHFQKLSLISWS